MNIWKIIYLNCGERYEFMTDHRSYTHNLSRCEIKPWRTFRPERDSNPCDTGAVLYQLSYQSNWELVTLWVRNIPVDGDECTWIYERSLIWTSEKDLKAWLIIAVMPYATPDTKKTRRESTKKHPLDAAKNMCKRIPHLMQQHETWWKDTKSIT